MKEAEKLFKEWLDSKNLTRIGHRYYDVVNWDGAEPKERFYSEIKLKEAFMAGFNADRWHYPSKGEYPPEGEEVLFICDGQNYLGTYSKISNYFDSRDMGSPASYVDCWQYIVPPKEEA